MKHKSYSCQSKRGCFIFRMTFFEIKVNKRNHIIKMLKKKEKGKKKISKQFHVLYSKVQLCMGINIPLTSPMA